MLYSRTLIGLLVPYGKPSSKAVCWGRDYAAVETVATGAVTALALEAQGARFNIDHTKSSPVPDARIKLFSNAAGVYCQCSIPDAAWWDANGEHSRTWAGLSIEFSRTLSHLVLDAPGGYTITRIDRVLGVALAIDKVPVFPTWVTSDFKAGQKRILAEQRQACLEQYGSIGWANVMYETPPQAMWCERELRAKDPDRRERLYRTAQGMSLFSPLALDNYPPDFWD